jgi:hypothetical protein
MDKDQILGLQTSRRVCWRRWQFYGGPGQRSASDSLAGTLALQPTLRS